METETWKPIPGFSKYEASNLGRIRRLWKKHYTILNGWKHYDGYWRLYLVDDDGRCRGNCLHSFVSRAWNGPTPPGLQIRHKDSNQDNNMITNLVIGTYFDNQCDKVMAGTMRRAPLCTVEIQEIRASPLPQAVLAVMYNVSQQTISNYKRGQGPGVRQRDIYGRSRPARAAYGTFEDRGMKSKSKFGEKYALMRSRQRLKALSRKSD
jgi:hypothetical protein